MTRGNIAKFVISLATAFNCISCESSTTQSATDQVRSATGDSCIFPIRMQSSGPAQSIKVTQLLNDLFESNPDAYVDYLDFENLKTITIGAAHECDSDEARRLFSAIRGLLRRYETPYALGRGSAGAATPSPDVRAPATLSELLSQASKGQAQLKDCVFIFDLNRAASVSPQQEQSFRARLENTRRYGVPLLYSFILDGKLSLVFYQQCHSGPRIAEFVQMVSDPKGRRLSRPRLASPQEVQTLVGQAGGATK